MDDSVDAAVVDVDGVTDVTGGRILSDTVEGKHTPDEGVLPKVGSYPLWMWTLLYGVSSIG